MKRLVIQGLQSTVSSEVGRRWNKLKMKYQRLKTITLLQGLYVNMQHSCGYRNRAGRADVKLK